MPMAMRQEHALDTTTSLSSVEDSALCRTSPCSNWAQGPAVTAGSESLGPGIYGYIVIRLCKSDYDITLAGIYVICHVPGISMLYAIYP